MTSGKIKYSQLDLKRLYLPGLRLKETCGQCQHKFTVDFAEHYPYDLKDNGRCQISYTCPQCETCFDKTMVLTLTLQPTET